MSDVSPASPLDAIITSTTAPAQIPYLAKRAEDLGYGQLWVPEDYFFLGGIAAATAALGATSSLPVGLGIVSALARHPAAMAMELATMEGLYPGRILPGIGLGVPHWVEQMGLLPKSPLTAMRETVTGIKRLLAGEKLTEAGKVHSFDEVELVHPPASPPPVHMGVVGPKMLQLSGEIADGTVVSVLASPTYVSWLRERIAEGQERAGRAGQPHKVSVFVLYAIDDDGAKAKQAIRDVTAFYLSAMPKSALTDVYGVGEQLTDMVTRGADDVPGLISREMPDEWIDDLVIAGDADECAARIQALLDAGADSVALFPVPDERNEAILERTARDVMPKFA